MQSCVESCSALFQENGVILDISCSQNSLRGLVWYLTSESVRPMSDFVFVGLYCRAAVMASSREHSREDDVGDLDSSFSELWIEG